MPQRSHVELWVHWSFIYWLCCCKGRISRWIWRILICPGFGPFHDFNLLIRMIFYCNRLESVLNSYFRFFDILGKSSKDQWNNIVIFTTTLLTTESTVTLGHQEVIKLFATILAYTFCQFILHLLLPLSSFKLTTIGLIFFGHELVHLVNSFFIILLHFNICILSFFAIVVSLLCSWRSRSCPSWCTLVVFEDLITNWNMLCFPFLVIFPHLLHPGSGLGC